MQVPVSAGAHPRSRGENIDDLAVDPDGPGSSPLTRGKRGFRCIARIVDRLIPAHAGKTLDSPRQWRRTGAHPHSRGENLAWSSMACTARGSSPLTRGKLLEAQGEGHRLGLIPAHAGKTATGPIVPQAIWAHPRSRGENERSSSMVVSLPGSSPLPRGKPMHQRASVADPGLILAHAGKTYRSQCIHVVMRAHPRSCEENAHIVDVGSALGGSSPLTRGKQAASRGCCVAARLIPTHAGKTLSSAGFPYTERAHPHSRRENRNRSYRPSSNLGSSPLMRGRLGRHRHGLQDRGLIPAHAGKTLSSLSRTSRGGAHPRSRGENHFEYAKPENVKGSSPLTRGKRIGNHHLHARPGLIPAHAGKT